MRILISLFLLTTVFFQSTFAIAENLDDLNPTKVSAEDRDFYEKLIVNANKVIAKNPKGLEGYYTRGVCEWKLKALDKAIADFQKVIEFCPYKFHGNNTGVRGSSKNGLIMSLNNIACVYALQRQYPEAIKYFTQVLELAPERFDTYDERGVAYSKMGETALADQDKKAAAKLRKEGTRIHKTFRAELAKLVEPETVGDNSNSARVLLASTYVIEKGGGEAFDMIGPRNQRFASNSNLGRYNEALADLDWLDNNAFRVETGLRVSYRQSVLKLLKAYGSSKRDFNPALFVDSPSNKLLKAEKLLDNHADAKAEVILREHLKQYPKDCMGWTALLRIHSKEPKKAFEDANQIVILDPTCRAALVWRAQAAFGLKNYKQAIDDYTTVLAFEPRSTFTRPADENTDKILFGRGEAFQKMHSYDQAIKDYTAILKVTPKAEEAYRYRADCYFAKGDYKGAVEDYSKSIEFDPQTAGSTYLLRAKVFDALKQPDLADHDRAKAKALGYPAK
jgi:tetratricopeptide (TPR) repeat protein